MSPNKNDETPSNTAGDNIGVQLKKKIQRLSNKIMKLEAEVTRYKEQVERHTEDSIEMASIIRDLRLERKHLKILLRTTESELAKFKGEPDPHAGVEEPKKKRHRGRKRKNGKNSGDDSGATG